VFLKKIAAVHNPWKDFRNSPGGKEEGIKQNRNFMREGLIDQRNVLEAPWIFPGTTLHRSRLALPGKPAIKSPVQVLKIA